MAVPANSYDRYTAADNVKEDNMDKIFNVTPFKTPVTSAAGRTTAGQTYHEWNRDEYRAPDMDNKALDGDKRDGTAKAPPVRIGNHCQIFREDFTVTRRADRVRKFGMDKACNYFRAKNAKELQTDLEQRTVSDRIAVPGSGAVEPETAGLAAMITTNISEGVGGASPAHNAGAQVTARTPGADRALTDGTWMQDVMFSCITESSESPDRAFMAPLLKRDAAGISGVAANRITQDKKKGKQMEAAIIQGVDVIETGAGEVALIPHYGMKDMKHILLLNMSHVNIAFIDGFVDQENGRDSDGRSFMQIIDACVQLDSEKAQGAIFDVAPN